MTEKKSPTEEFTIKGEDVIGKLKEIIKKGNVRKVIIRDKKGKDIAEFPLTIGVVGAIAVPPLAAIGTIVALVSECSISVVKEKGGD